MKDLQPLNIQSGAVDAPIIVAGPCCAENEEMLLNTASQLASYGIKVFRAGLWKPRTKPGTFEGVGEAGIPWMAKVKEQTGMLTATEVATRAHIKAAVEGGIDVLWIGARTSANPFAMQEIADTLGEMKVDLPVLVKNPVNPDLELWIGALQRLYNAGIRRLGAIHRGFSSYGKHLYRNMPLWRIPIELRRRYPNLPIVCDPSHMGGKRELVAPLSQQALDMGFDGLFIESHCNVECALSDKEQQLQPEVLNYVLENLVYRHQNISTENLSILRQEIDRLDNELVEILSKRMEVCREIGQYKKEHQMPVLQTQRYDSILNTRASQAQRLGLDPDFMKTVLSAIHEESVRQQILISENE